MFSANFYDKLDPTYLQEIRELEEDLKLIDEQGNEISSHWKNPSRQKLYMTFSRNYMMPSLFWDKYYDMSQYDIHSYLKNLIHTSLYNLYYDDKIMYHVARRHKVFAKLLKRKIMDASVPRNSGPITIADLSYPNKYLTDSRKRYEKESFYILPKKVILKMEEMKKLYLKMKAVEENGDEEKWIEALMEANDEEFVKNNIEYKLGKDLTNKKLWKLYIEYLKEKDVNTLLQTYSKYCRFFTDDSEMKEEYSKAAEKQEGPVSVLWKNPFQWEKHVEYFKSESSAKKRKHSPNKQPSGPTHYFNQKTALPQKFPFRPTYMDYIIIHANSYVLQSLYLSCKWFFIRNTARIFHKYSLNNATNFTHSGYRKLEGQSLTVYGPVNACDILVATFLHINFCKPETLSQFFKSLYRCEARYIKLERIAISAAEIKLLLEYGAVIEFVIHDIYIIDGDSNPLILEDVLALTPKIEHFSAFPISVTPNTAKNISELPFQSKFEYFFARCDLIDVNDFFEFVKKNFTEESQICLRFRQKNVTTDIQDRIKDFGKTIKALTSSHWTTGDKPYVKVS